MRPHRLLFATTNSGKADELRAYLENLPVEVLVTADLADPPEIVEDRETLAGNARKKAETLFAHAGIPTVADDTGLEVDALDGRPGVRSARLAGPEASDAENRDRLLDVLNGAADRSARFRTVLAYVTNEGTRFYEGICAGTILQEERGTGEFGYDRLFRPSDRETTFAEMDPEEKNQISHRGRALRSFAEALEADLRTESNTDAGDVQ